jgi:LysR family pca operon transcriptional activator
MSVHHRIKLRHLRTFVEIARHGALKPAAETLNMTQPAVSKVLKDLEDIVGFHLVNRSRRGASLTEAGEVFLQFAEQSLISLQQGLTSLKAIESGTVGQLRIGALPSVAARLLPIAAMRFRELSPAQHFPLRKDHTKPWSRVCAVVSWTWWWGGWAHRSR